METFVNDTIKLTVDTDIDVSGYATLVIKYRKPDGTLGRWLASVCSGDVNCLTYTTFIGDLDIPGDWLVQGYVEDASEQLNGRWVKFTVHAPLLATCPPWYLKFFAQTGTFTPGNTIYQTVDGVTAFATIDAVDMLGSNYGILTLSGISGTFQDNEIIYESALGSELLANNDFETYTGTQDDGTSDTFNSWRIYSTDATHTMEATATIQSGSNAVKIVKASASPNSTIDKLGFAETDMGGKYVRLSTYVKTDGVNRAEILLYDRTHADYLLWKNSGYQTSYTEEVFYVFVPSGCVLLEVSLRMLAAGTGTIYFDNSSLKEVTNAALANGVLY